MLRVSVPSPGSFDLLDDGVRGLGAGVRDAGRDQGEDLGPPRVHGVPQAPGLGQVSRDDEAAQPLAFFFCRGGISTVQEAA